MAWGGLQKLLHFRTNGRFDTPPLVLRSLSQNDRSGDAIAVLSRFNRSRRSFRIVQGGSAGSARMARVAGIIGRIMLGICSR